MSKRRRTAAFTLTEMMIATTLSGVLAGIIYLVAGESLASFARNVSINRAYTDARLTLDRIAQTVATAGHTPILVDTNGLALTNVTTTTQAAGIRFYRARSQSSYLITSGSTGPSSVNNTMTLQVAAGQAVPLVKDVIVIPALGGTQGVSYQGVISKVTNGGTTCTLTFVDTLYADCTPAPTATINLNSPALYALCFTQVAYITVGNQLRYYPQAKSVAVDTAAVFNNPANYLVVCNLVSNAFNGGGTAATPLLPFSLANPPTVTVQLYAENPDYNTRTTAAYNSINSYDTYTYMQSSLGPRSAAQVHAPY